MTEEEQERQRLYWIWCDMRYRCSKPRHKSFCYYGGRGIKVCNRWNDSFDAWLEDMGPRPGRTLSIDRINNEGPYEPDNCRWADRQTQNMNKSLYRSNTTGARNIERRPEGSYRVRLRRNGQLVADKTFAEIQSAILWRDARRSRIDGR